jgi:hypothetical protein
MPYTLLLTRRTFGIVILFFTISLDLHNPRMVIFDPRYFTIDKLAGHHNLTHRLRHEVPYIFKSRGCDGTEILNKDRTEWSYESAELNQAS